MNKLFIIIVVFFNFFLWSSIFAQNKVAQTNFADKSYYLVDSLNFADLSKFDRHLIDSCLIEFYKTKSDTSKVNAIKKIIDKVHSAQLWPKYNSWLCQFILDKLKVNQDVSEILYLELELANVYEYLGWNYYYKNIDLAQNYFEKALKLHNKCGNKLGAVICYNNLAYVYSEKGNVLLSIEFCNKSLFLNKSVGDKIEESRSYSFLGETYRNQGDLTLALENYKKALSIEKEDIESKIVENYSIGRILELQGNNNLALGFYKKALKLSLETDEKRGVAISYNYIGSIYHKQGDFSLAKNYYLKSLKIEEELGNKAGMAFCLAYIGELEFEQKKASSAKINGEKGMFLAQEIKHLESIKLNAKLLRKVANKQRDYKVAFEMYQLEIQMRDSINNEKNYKTIIQQQSKFEYESKKAKDSIINVEKEKLHLANLAIEKAKSEKNELELETQKSQKWYLYIGLSFAALFALFMFNRFKVTQKQKNVIEKQKIEVEIKQKELELTYKSLQLANTEIKDSINYAELIQNAVLPSLSTKDLLNESFLYFNPKDKVSGDFFWLEQKEVYSAYCVADCTGHGIPGAFISMVGTILLNEIHNSKKINVPNDILNELSRLIQMTLTDKDGNTMKDGMDLSFVLLNNETKVLYFSGANNPIWIVSKQPQKRIDKTEVNPIFEMDGKYMYEVKADKQPIGYFDNMEKPFTLHRIELIADDTFYLFSDGYVDQFGGPQNKKFKAKSFRELLLRINNDSMENQKIRIENTFENWKGAEEQVDDVTIMGVKI